MGVVGFFDGAEEHRDPHAQPRPEGGEESQRYPLAQNRGITASLC